MMVRSVLCGCAHVGLAMLIVTVGAPTSSAGENGPEDRSASGRVGAFPVTSQAPVLDFAGQRRAPFRTKQEPSDPAPYVFSGRRTAARFSAQESAPGTPRELLPDLGQIGAQVTLLVGFSTSPFGADDGLLAGGAIDLPIFNVAGGKISYEIAVTNQRATTDVRITSPLSAVGDLLALDGLGETVTSQILSSLKDLPATEDLDLLTVLPFGLKYTITTFDHHRIRPYVVGAVGVYVTITDQDPGLTVDPRLEGPFIGGIAPEAIELAARGVPEGQGDIRFGGNFGGGLEVRVAARGSLALEYRYHRIEGTNADFSTLVGQLGLHF